MQEYIVEFIWNHQHMSMTVTASTSHGARQAVQGLYAGASIIRVSAA